jgi:hypothetical protein
MSGRHPGEGCFHAPEVERKYSQTVYLMISGGATNRESVAFLCIHPSDLPFQDRLLGKTSAVILIQ